jgi:hypothetical protein
MMGAKEFETVHGEENNTLHWGKSNENKRDRERDHKETLRMVIIKKQ